MSMIYLDNASTKGYSNFDDIIVNTITQAMRDSWMNPSSLYASNVKNKINKCRENLANFIGAEPNEIYYTSGGSESNCMAIQGFVKECELKNIHPIVITSTIEHKSIRDCVDLLNVEKYLIGVDKKGFIDIDKLEKVLKLSHGRGSILVSIQYANNEIGTIQPIEEIARITHKYNGVLHVDAVQCIGQIPMDVKVSNIDMLSASGHKISPVLKGIGFLYKKDEVDIQPIIYGSQEFGLRGGTENTFGILGLNKAIEMLGVDFGIDDKGKDMLHEKYYMLIAKRDYLIKRLTEEFGCIINGTLQPRLPNNVNVTFPRNVSGESLLYMLSISNIFISTSSACNSHSIKPSHVLTAIGLSDEEAMKSIRITISENITYDNIDYVIEEIDKNLKILEL